jgi:putative zinc finger/helix-turn-helix YgiT family protein
MKENTGASKPTNLECPNCDSTNVGTRMTLTKFNYGSGNRAVELETQIPFRKCNNCGFEYTDSEAEDLRHEAICRFLGVMTPAEVVGVRKQYELTRAEFAQKSRIGEASLARWETGELIQNAAYDDYLYLLSFPENIERLNDRRKGQPRKEQGKVLQFSRKFKGRGLDEAAAAAKEAEAEAFRLRK